MRIDWCRRLACLRHHASATFCSTNAPARAKCTSVGYSTDRYPNTSPVTSSSAKTLHRPLHRRNGGWPLSTQFLTPRATSCLSALWRPGCRPLPHDLRTEDRPCEEAAGLLPLVGIGMGRWPGLLAIVTRWYGTSLLSAAPPNRSKDPGWVVHRLRGGNWDRPLVQGYRRPINHISKPPVYRAFVCSFGSLVLWR
jgi:hypothetical protein